MEVQLKRPTPENASPALKAHQHLTVMVSSAVVINKSLNVQGHAIGFATTDVKDHKQRWMKVQDPVRKNAFAIVNQATGKAIQIPTAAQQPVRLALYKPNDPSLLWTETAEDDGYSIIREFVDTDLVLETDLEDNDPQVVAANYSGSDNQLWKIEQERKA